MTSTYFGKTTIVLKFPLTRAASTKGLQRYRGLFGVVDGDGGTGAIFMPSEGNVAEVGVGERFGARGVRASLRLSYSQQIVPSQKYILSRPKRVEKRHLSEIQKRVVTMK